ncbi:hypothetical protein H310_13336 [Aphanomyces invadans]|uniref:Peptidase A2 domain-containing protein n=1 Tax=Aphanomyces invadans TaxID=157072 RepID=A0A024TFA6_9STRA|nr:hypothetical protein H310_13336 [Aphanomyces invadans]ETV92271.1 hypothetical protein H310_13336 [Aphanomyces invadans]|eukprot:XP_008879022.1 hypothetical protein H310_13336 [Aphanomyces invadans]
MPVGACMDPFTKRQIAMFDLNKDHNLVTETEWIAWFHAAFEENPQDLDVLKRRLTSAIRFDMKILDAESRVGRMLDDLMRVLEHDHQERMGGAILPETLKSAVQKQLQLQRNKSLKSDVFRFVNWLRQFSAGFQLYVGLEEESVVAPTSKTDGERSSREAKQRQEAARRMFEMRRDERAGQERINVLADKSNRRSTDRGAHVEDIVRVENVLLDTGADVNVVSRGVMEALATGGIAVDVVEHAKPQLVFPYGETAAPLKMSRRATFGKVTLETTCGPLVLRGLKAWIDDTASTIDLNISRPVMEVLGFSVDDLLVGARRQKSEWDVSDGVEDPPDPCIDDNDGMQCATAEVVDPKFTGDSDEVRREKRDRVLAVLIARVNEAQRRGLDADDMQRLTALLMKHVDVFREDLGNDPTVKVEPLKVRIKPNATPVKCIMRRYPPAHVEYMREHVEALEANGIGALRMTIDSRPINACTDPMPWPMPNLDSALVCLEGTSVYFTLDWTKGYWKLPLHADSQEYFSFMTPFGVYTPTRVLMGQTDAVACYDLLGSAKTTADLFVLLDQVLSICAAYGLKLSQKRCHFFLREAEWCGKVILAAGMKHSPSRSQVWSIWHPP